MKRPRRSTAHGVQPSPPRHVTGESWHAAYEAPRPHGYSFANFAAALFCLGVAKLPTRR